MNRSRSATGMTATTTTTAAAEEEEESVLPLDEQTMRPPDYAITQQRVQAFHPILHPEVMIYTFFLFAIIMIPVGFKLENLSQQVVELKTTYDSIDPNDQVCGIGTNYYAGDTCRLQFTVPQDMEPPILVYYELTNFYQNHRFYSTSRDDFQLSGKVYPTLADQDPILAGDCDPLNVVGNQTLNPCGLIANTFFNDKFTLTQGVDTQGNDLVLIEEGIAWQTDLEYRFAMPEGYQQEACDDQTLACDESNAACCTSRGFSCLQPHLGKDGICYAYDYPHDNTTRYLYETYPDVISPLEHVTNEHFVVWMRVATRPTFRKLYGYFEQPIAEGTVLEFELLLNYVVESFEGSKSILISTNSVVGGRNPYLGPTFYYMGFFLLGCGIIFALKHWFRPRKIADRKYLKYKED